MSTNTIYKNQYQVDVMPYWRDILINLLNNPAGLKFIKKENNSITSIEFKKNRDDEILQFATDVGYITEINRGFKFLDSFEGLSTDSTDVLSSVKYFTQIMFSLLHDWEYLNSNEEVDQLHKVEFVHWQLTMKGIDIALKLQEHKDNDKRHNAQLIVSQTLKTNSTISLFISSGAALVSVVALAFAYQIFQVNNERLNIAKTNLIKHEEQEVILKKTVDHIATLKSIELKFINLEKEHSQILTKKTIRPKPEKTRSKVVLEL